MSNFAVVSLLEERIGVLEAALSVSAEKRDEAMAKPSNPGLTFFERADAVAIIPVRGVLLDEWSPYGPRWGATGYNYIRRAVEQAAGDAQVRATVLDMDSPGGLVDGMIETAAVIERCAKAASGKPIFAVIRSLGASACYALACNADTVIASPSASVGSIGARLTHISLQGALDKAGVKVTEISSHEGKADGSVFRDLTEAAKARLQAEIDDAAAAFVQLVARRRKMTTKVVNALNAELFPAQSATGRRTAIDVGLADHVAAADDVIREIISKSRA